MENAEALDLLVETINIDTTLGNEAMLADMLQKVFEAYHFDCEQVEYSPGRTGLIAIRVGNEPGPCLGYSGHLDVVPVGEVAWETNPFQAQMKNGKLYGRGTCDMKGGLVALMAGVFRFLENDDNFKGKIKFVITVGEETASIGAKQMLDLGHVDDLDALLIAEPTNLAVGVAHKGALWPAITFYGKTAHGSMPYKGINAIENALLAIEAIGSQFDFSKEVDEAVGPSTSSLNIIRGGTNTNVVPDQCQIVYDIRTLVSQDHETLKKEFKRVLDELAQQHANFKYKLDFVNDLPAMQSNPSDPFVQAVVEAVSEVTGQPAVMKNPAYYTDASIFFQSSKDFPIVILGPGIAEMAHQPNEYIELNKFNDMIALVTRLTGEYLG